MELASATLLDGHDYLSHSRRKTHLHGTLETRHAICHPTTIHTSETVDTISQHTCLRLEPRGMVPKGLLELVGRSDSDWTGDSATRQSVTGYHCDVQNVTVCNRRSVSVHAKQSFMQPVLAQENCWDSHNSSRNFITTFQFVSRWIHSADNQADSNTSKYDAWQYNSR